MKYPHIVFDFDGVLCDSINLSIESYSFIRGKHFSFLPEINSKLEYEKVFSGNPDSCLHKWLTPDESTFFYEEQTKYYFENSDKLKLFEGIADLLLSFPKIDVSILTSNLKILVNKILIREFGLQFTSQISIFSKELGLSKLEMFKILLQNKNIKANDTFYVCDSEMDIKVSNELMINTIAVAYGYFSIEILQNHKPTFQVHDVTELSLILKNLMTDDSKSLIQKK